MAIARGSIVLLMLLGGCATSRATTGLPNAPQLGTATPEEDRAAYDVVSDGVESCEVSPTETPRVWSQSPPCPTVAPPAPPVVPPAKTPPPAPTWLPRSRWSVTECAVAEPGIEPAEAASCCPVNEPVCSR